VPTLCCAEQQANEQLSASLTKIHGWGGPAQPQPLCLRKLIFSAILGLKRALQPRHLELGQAELYAAGRALRPCSNGIQYGQDNLDNELGLSSTPALSESSDKVDNDPSDASDDCIVVSH
jgi:hypothetical protein